MGDVYEAKLSSPEKALAEAHNFITELASQLTADLRASVELAIIEFVENAVKYASPQEVGVWARLTVELEGNRVSVCIVSRPRNREDVQSALIVLRRIRDAKDVSQLYKERLMELMKHPGTRPRLGLLRVAYEGEFELSAQQPGPMLELTATRQRHCIHPQKT